jgi:hypothetical protein
MSDKYERKKVEWMKPDTINSNGRMMVKPFLDEVASYQKEILCDGSSSIASHKLQSSVQVRVIHPITGEIIYGDVKWIEPYALPGCGCWDGIVIVAEQESD